MPKSAEKLSVKERQAMAQRVSLVCIIVNALLCVFKFLAGILAASAAMVSDAVHSASDVLATGIALIGIRIAGQAADEKHPYGHDRFECIASLILAGILFLTGASIGWRGLQTILAGNYAALPIPGRLALIAAVISIVVKEAMYHYTMRAAKKTASTALRASAWDHRSDALSSLGAFAGILGARLGLPVLDSVASLIICLCILKAAIDIFRESIDKTVDKACDETTQQQLRQTVLSVPGVLELDQLQTRQFGAAVYVDIEIAVSETLSLKEAHRIAEAVHSAVESTDDLLVRHCTVHVNPCAKSPG